MPTKKQPTSKTDTPADEPSLHGVGPDDPTYQKLATVGPETRPDTPEKRRDAVLKDQAADLAGKPRP